MIQSRNLLYQTKKSAYNHPSIDSHPVDSQEDVRQQLKELRNKNRAQQTQIIRLKDQVHELRQKILFYQEELKVNGDKENQQNQKSLHQSSAIPMIIQNKQLKQEIAHIHEVNLTINAKNRSLQAENRQLESDLKRSKTKLKQLEILQNIRSQNFQKELQNAKPIIVQENKDLQILSECIKKIITFMKQKVISVSFEIFQKSARECENQKKSNSYNIFLNYWNELRKSKHLGYMALAQCMKSMNQLQPFLNYDKTEIFDINDSKYRDTLNEWIINTLTEIKYMKNSSKKTQQQKLFRLLSLLYRSRFPIKGEKYSMDEDVKKYFQELLCSEIFQRLADS